MAVKMLVAGLLALWLSTVLLLATCAKTKTTDNLVEAHSVGARS